MLRSLPFIIAALRMTGLSAGTAGAWAPTIQKQAVKHHIDPITLVALLEGESGGRTGVVNHLGCVGLFQVCVKFIYPYCKKGSSYNKAKCDAKVAQLKNPLVNIAYAAGSISSNRKFCNKLTNKTTRKTRNQWRHWFPSHGGYNKGSLRHKTGVWCGQKYVCTKRRGKRCVRRGWRNVAIPKTIQKYMKRRRQIIRQVRRRRK